MSAKNEKEKTFEKKPNNNPANYITVSTNRVSNFYVFLSKMRLKEHELIEVHALGNAVPTAVMTAENLVRYF
jgi:hypothetical protein